MRDANIPKFLSDDLPLFNALIQDLFPGVTIEEQNKGELESQVIKSIEDQNLQLVSEFKTKVIQLFETFDVRFGVMLVGPTGSGKTTCFKTLAHAETKLREKNSKDRRFQKVSYDVLNPKSITMDELYGKVDVDTQEWTDGLASEVMR